MRLTGFWTLLSESRVCKCSRVAVLLACQIDNPLHYAISNPGLLVVCESPAISCNDHSRSLPPSLHLTRQKRISKTNIEECFKVSVQR